MRHLAASDREQPALLLLRRAAAELMTALQRRGERLRHQIERRVDVQHAARVEEQDALGVGVVEVGKGVGILTRAGEETGRTAGGMKAQGHFRWGGGPQAYPRHTLSTGG